MSEYDDCTVAEIERDIRKAEEEIRDLQFKLEAELQRRDEISAECRRLRFALEAIRDYGESDGPVSGVSLSEWTGLYDFKFGALTKSQIAAKALNATGGRDE